MYNDKFLYKVVICVFVGVILWKEKEAHGVYHDLGKPQEPGL